MLLSNKIKELILKKESFILMRDEAKKEGLTELRQEGVRKALQGITTLEEVNRVTVSN